jgi:hypothetical protein
MTCRESSGLLVRLIRTYDRGRRMPDAQQKSPEAQARHFVLTTVWQGLSQLAHHINAQTDRIATVTVDSAAKLGRVSLCVYPVGSQPAQATLLFRYEVAVNSVGSGVRVQFVAQPTVVNGQVQSQEQGELAMPGTEGGDPMTPQRIREDVARRFQAVMDARTARGAGC